MPGFNREFETFANKTKEGDNTKVKPEIPTKNEIVIPKDYKELNATEEEQKQFKDYMQTGRDLKVVLYSESNKTNYQTQEIFAILASQFKSPKPNTKILEAYPACTKLIRTFLHKNNLE